MNIFVLHCGGTISCRINGEGYLTPSSDMKKMFSEISKEFGDITFTHGKVRLFLSEYLNGSKLNSIISAVKNAVDSGSYDGITITLGSDTEAYAAAAIGYFFGNNSIPIVTVSSDLPAEFPGSTALLHLRAAAALICFGNLRGVYSVSADSDKSVRVNRATRLIRRLKNPDGVFSAGQEYGKISFPESGLPFFSKNPLYSETESDAVLRCPEFGVNSPVMHITVTPGMIYPRPPSSVKSVILGAYHSGTLDTESRKTEKFAKLCKKKNITVFTDSTGTGSDYLSTKKFSQLGFFRLPPDVSAAAFYMKLWILAERKDPETVRQVYTSYAGDIPPINITDQGGENNGR